MWRLRLRRRRWLARAAVHDALSAAWAAPLPASGAAPDEVDFLVCDAEMSGLDPATAELLSLGWVRIRALEVCFDSAEHRLIRNAASVGQSATVHRLRDCELSGAGSAEAALLALLEAARGCVLVFHHAPLDLAFLDRAAKRLLGAPLLLPAIDTLKQERRLLERRDHPPGDGELRLQACRERYGLLPHSAHNALADALATAELLLAQIAARGEGLRLRDML
jgi:DNA polymerase-3 subunit epsilon